MAPKASKPIKKDTTLKRPAARINVSTLAALGQVNLKDKVALLLQRAEGTFEQKICKVKTQLTKPEISKICGQHNTALKNGEAPVHAVDEPTGKEKGKNALAWFIEKRSGVASIGKLLMTASSSMTVDRREHWKPKLFFMSLFGQEEFDQHLASGRLTWRECIKTRGVWEYQDTEDQVAVKSADQQKELQVSETKDGDELMAIMGQDAHLILHDQQVWKPVQDGKGGKDVKGGKCGKGGKGKGGKGGTPLQLALTNVDPVEETVDEAIEKLRTMKGLLTTTSANYNELIIKVERSNSKFWSKAAKVSADAQAKKMTIMIAKLKKSILSPKDVDVANVKKELLAAAKVYKAAQCDMKEYKHILSDKKPKELMDV